MTFDHHIYSLCHRYWTCTASEARYVFSGYRILTDGVINRTRFVVFCDHFPVVLRWDGVIIGLTNILNRSGVSTTMQILSEITGLIDR